MTIQLAEVPCNCGHSIWLQPAPGETKIHFSGDCPFCRRFLMKTVHVTHDAVKRVSLSEGQKGGADG